MTFLFHSQKVQGGITYAGNSTFNACLHIISWKASTDFHQTWHHWCTIGWRWTRQILGQVKRLKLKVQGHGGITYRVGQKKCTPNALHITSSNVGRFSQLFHCYNLWKICNAAVINYPTTPYEQRHTVLDVSCWARVSSCYLFILCTYS